MACVRKRRGKWIVDFRDQNGRRRWETYDTRKEADAALARRHREVRAGSYIPQEAIPTFAEVAKDWLATKQDYRAASYAHWQGHLDLHLIPAIGDFRLDQIRVSDVDTFRVDRRKANLAPKTVNKMLTTGAAVFAFAAKRELIERNPFAVADRCRLNAGEVTVSFEATSGDSDVDTVVDPASVLSPDQAHRLVQHAAPGFYQTFFLTALLTGARVGELTALTLADIDFDAGTILIRRSVSWARHRGEKGPCTARFYEPKTVASRRLAEMPPELAAALRRWILACPKGEHRLVFPTTDGTRPRHRTTIAKEGLQPALKAAGLPPVTIHSLRHTFASSLILNGCPVTEVAHRLGHSNPATTLRVYAHFFAAVKTNAVAELAQIVCGSKTVAAPPESGGAATGHAALSA